MPIPEGHEVVQIYAHSPELEQQSSDINVLQEIL